MPQPHSSLMAIIERQLDMLDAEIPPLLVCRRLDETLNDDGYLWPELAEILSETQLQAIIAHNAASLRMVYFLEGKIPDHMV